MKTEQDGTMQSLEQLASIPGAIPILGRGSIFLDPEGTIRYIDQSLKERLDLENQPGNVSTNDGTGIHFSELLRIMGLPDTAINSKYTAMQQALAQGQEFRSSNIPVHCTDSEAYFTLEAHSLGEEGSIVKMQDATDQVLSTKYDPRTENKAITSLYFDLILKPELKEIAEHLSYETGFIEIDLRGLRQFNSSGNDAYGDRMIAETAKVLSRAVGDEYSIVRKGGDEFLVVVPNSTPETLAEIQEKIERERIHFNDQIRQEVIEDLRAKGLKSSRIEKKFTMNFYYGSGLSHDVEQAIEDASSELYADKERVKAQAHPLRLFFSLIQPAIQTLYAG